jgi:hypothetical protein
MRYTWSWGILPLLVIAAIMILGAAQPFERVPAGDAAYTQLAALDGAGLLGDYSLPTGELSRLEVAVLVQQALANYGDALLKGAAADALTEEALSGLSASFDSELAQLGVKPAPLVAVAPASSGMADLADRVQYLEDEQAADDETEVNAAKAAQLAEEEAAADEASAVDVKLYGDITVHAYADSTEFTTTGADSNDTSDVDMYWGELGVDAVSGDWKGHFSVLLDDDGDEDVVTNEAYLRYDHPCNGFYGVIGRATLPWGNNDYYFPTYPASNDLAYTTADTIGLGYDGPTGFGISGWVFNPRVDITGDEDSMSDYALRVDLLNRAADECNVGYRLAASYSSNLGAHDIRLAGDGPLADRVGAYNVFGRLDLGGNKCHFIADYTAAADEFDAADLDTVQVTGETVHVGDKPSALNMEFVYEPETDTLYGVSYQATEELADYAKTRYGVMYGQRLSDLVMMKFEYSHGDYDEYATAAQDTDDRFVAEFNLAF